MRHQKYKNKHRNRNRKQFQPIKISINDMDKFEKKELTKKRTFTKNTWYYWYDWLIKGPFKKYVTVRG